MGRGSNGEICFLGSPCSMEMGDGSAYLVKHPRDKYFESRNRGPAVRHRRSLALNRSEGRELLPPSKALA